jgi:prevent-host-death family protein
MMASSKSNAVVIPATQAHRNFGDLIKRAFSGREHFIVEKDGLPVVVIISMAEYESLMQQKEAREERLKQFEHAARAIGGEIEARGLSEEEIETQVDHIRQRLQQKRHGK